eukprot:m.11726 g.11726  ORF g.11726 m.11726 type:complete len:104 (+) comp23565_c0_seq2:2878-3189(+)
MSLALTSLVGSSFRVSSSFAVRFVHATTLLQGKHVKFGNPKPKLVKESEVEEEGRDGVTIHACRRQIEGGPWKMNLVAKQVRMKIGLTVGELGHASVTVHATH